MHHAFRDGPTQDELIAALARYRDREFATLVVSTIEIMASTHPVELRRALGRVFDTKPLEDYASRAMEVVTDAQQAARAAAEEARTMQHDTTAHCDEMRKQVDTLRIQLDELARRVAKAEKVVNGAGK